ncbi:hypothetical protein B0T25DRAFT_538919 [Lasiosphaeria hispida]|uniref:Uncharacterized protein n=1 Tax=Lasiosphaeria hispida TaxID=260671 RepID=A0AAJ0HLZ5_9PEZI|nr:hypothetical protein B0T25DRAFT_538919 [Lasiosphaeria hispida]
MRKGYWKNNTIMFFLGFFALCTVPSWQTGNHEDETGQSKPQAALIAASYISNVNPQPTGKAAETTAVLKLSPCQDPPSDPAESIQKRGGTMEALAR